MPDKSDANGQEPPERVPGMRALRVRLSSCVALVMSLAIALSGCTESGGGDDAGPSRPLGDEGVGDEGGGGPDDGQAPTPGDAFDPVEHAWSGQTDLAACGANFCLVTSAPQGDSTHSLHVPPGAAVAEFTFTWSEPLELNVGVAGPPVPNGSYQRGPSPLSFTVPLEASGALDVFTAAWLVGDYTAGAQGPIAFEMRLVLR